MIQYIFPVESADLSFHYNHTPYPYMHTHNFWEITLVTEGSYVHKINRKIREIKKDTLCLIRPNDQHSLHATNKQKATHINIRIRDSLIKKLFDIFDEATYSQLLNQDFVELQVSSNISQYTLESIYKLQTLTTSNPLYQNMLTLLFLDLFRIILNDVIVNTYPNDKQYAKPVQNLIELMSDPNNIHLNIEDVCKLSNYSHSYLIKVFKKYLNTTPSKYFTNLKMTYARSQLEGTALPIAHIASNIGINNTSHFNTAFKKVFNITPGQYRKKWHIYYNSFSKVKK